MIKQLRKPIFFKTFGLYLLIIVLLTSAILIFSDSIHPFHIALVITLISLLIALLFTKSLSKPIKDLEESLQKVASGNFNTKIYLKNNDEFKKLADSFNYMTGEISSVFAELSRKKEELNSIISSIQSGLLVLDKEGRVLLCNESFKNIINNKLSENKFYWEIIREPAFNEFIKRVREEKKNITNEVELNNNVFLCSATELVSGNELAVVFHDITEIKNIETMKKNFITNVSHELKTPLASIKGFIETLEEDINDAKNKHYIDVIKRNIDRLIGIVQDLLTLSKLEEKGLKPELQRVNLKTVLEDILKVFEQILKEKNLKLILDLGQGLPDITADSFKIEQLFVNLIDNAIKYTEKGEIKISIKQAGSIIKIEVEDTGLGIPKEHLPRIFERFYVIDKSRSRKYGGTGLGLSIVKHIVLLHNGKIAVESNINQGTKFTINLPI